MSVPPDSARLIRRLRVALVLLAMLVGVALVAVIAVVLYWNTYLLDDRGDDPFTRGPFVAGLSATTAEVRFLGPDASAVQLTAIAPDGTHVVAKDGLFAGLEPGERYVWTAAVDGIGQASGSFLTAPTGPDARVTFGVLGDYGSGSAHEYAVGRGLDAIDPAFVLTTGDNSYPLALPQLLDRNIFRPLRGVMSEAPLIVNLGDHDTFLGGGQAIVDALQLPNGGLRYVWQYGPVQVIVLGVKGDAATVAYAKAELAKPWSGVRFIAIHDALKPGEPLSLAVKGKVTAVFSGHLHRYERRIVDGTLNITAGNGGQGSGDPAHTLRTPEAVYSTLDYGFARVDVSPTGTRIELIDEAGVVRDSVTVPRP